ncbi:cyclase family protein [Salinarimonas chemoclinalis]|uniref:cyclase family protein n=1 Tax=Salinarimonas chemoclinalis TaxID=3241599 RepID=UPI0035584A89
MCDICVTNAVKDRMLSRRDVFRRGAGGAAAIAAVSAGAATLGTSPARAQIAGAPVDLTHTLHEGFPTFFGEQQFFVENVFNYAEHMFNLNVLRVNEHTGTHVDAPLHFSQDGASVDEIPVTSLVAPLAIVDIREKAAQDADAQVTPDDLEAWIARHGPLPEGCCVAMLSGWGAHVDDDRFRNADGEGTMHFPGFHVEAARMLLEESSAVGIAVDTLSLDHGPSPDFATHYAWLPEGRWGLECVANLEALPPAGATLVLGAPKHRGGSGGPARVLAFA